MSGIPRLPHGWNRVAAESERKEAVSLKMSFVKFNIVFYILFMWIAVTHTIEVPSKKEKFEWLELDYGLVSAHSQSLKYCFQTFRLANSGWKEKIHQNMSIINPISIVCGPKENETRYSIPGSRWSSSNLKYKIISYPRRTAIIGGYATIDREFEKAFTLWESVSDLRFTATKDWYEADINIRFMSGFHGDKINFTSSNAHAFLPTAGGDIHFNDDLEWTIGTSLGHNIFQIAVHEVGHALGLGHYRHNDSVMYPSEKVLCTGICNHVYRSNFTLHSDDIEAIQIIYGKKSKTTLPKQEHESQPWLLITWVAIAVACILSLVIVAVGVTQIIRCRKQVSECYWTQVEFGVSLK